MIIYEYLNVPIPATLAEHMEILKEYGAVGWYVAAMYNGYIFFERRIKTKVG